MSSRKSRRELKKTRREASSQLKSGRNATSYSVNSNFDQIRAKNEAVSTHEKHNANEAYQVG